MYGDLHLRYTKNIYLPCEPTTWHKHSKTSPSQAHNLSHRPCLVHDGQIPSFLKLPEPHKNRKASMQCLGEHTGNHGIGTCKCLLWSFRWLHNKCTLPALKRSAICQIHTTTRKVEIQHENAQNVKIWLPHPKWIQSSEMTTLLPLTMPGSFFSSQVATILEGQRIIHEILEKTRWDAKEISSDWDKGMTWNVTSVNSMILKSKRLLRMNIRLFPWDVVTFYQKVRYFM